MKWAVKDVINEDTWFDEYVKLALTDHPAPLPLECQRVGNSIASWFPCEEGIAFIHTVGGSSDDRVLAEIVLRNQLKGHGYKQAQYYFGSSEKTSTWDDVMAKAKRLKDAGNVTVLRNGANNIVGHVIGDHGEYQTEISREDPNSQAITQWQCECPWDQYAWQRTRQWKKYEGRPCAHVMATFWASQQLPLDEEVAPGQQQQQPSLFNAPQTARPQFQPSPFMAPGQMPPQGEQMQLPGMFPGQATGTPPAPSQYIPQPADVLPQFQNPADQPVVNPASVPGLRQPSPTNPTQYPGGTFSSWSFKDEDGIMEFVSADFNQQPSGFQSGNMVSTKADDWGTWVGKSEDHGAGSPAKIPARSVGEVMSQDPTTGMVQVLFMDSKLGVQEFGKLMPYGATAWFFPTELEERPDVQRPGPAIKRRK